MIAAARTFPGPARLDPRDPLSRRLAWAVAPGLGGRLAATPAGAAGAGTAFGGATFGGATPWGATLAAASADSNGGASWPYPASLLRPAGDDGSGGKDVTVAVLARVDGFGSAQYNKLLSIPYRTTGWTTPWATVAFGREAATSQGKLEVGDTGGANASALSPSGYLQADGAWRLYAASHRNTPSDGGVYFYLDGRPFGSGSINPGVIHWGCNTQVCLLNATGYAPTNATAGAVAFAAIWRRLLRPGEHRRLARVLAGLVRPSSRAAAVAPGAMAIYPAALLCQS